MEPFLRARGLPEYYQCDVVNKTLEQWCSEGKVDLPRGIITVIFGVICQVLYLPCLLVLLKSDLAEQSVYKIIAFITVCDMLNVASNSLVTGYYFITGTVFCCIPHFQYLWGIVVISSWGGCCLGCFLLVLSRIINLLSARCHGIFFEGRGLIVVFLALFSYVTFFAMYAKPSLFNSKIDSWLWDPLIHEDGRDYEHFASPLFVINNTGTVISTFLMTLLFFFVFAYKMKKNYNFSLEKKELQLLAQSCLMCLINLTAALCYVYVQLVPAGAYMALIALTTWQFSSAGNLLLFYVVNRSVRTRILSLVGIRNAKVNDRTASGAVTH